MESVYVSPQQEESLFSAPNASFAALKSDLVSEGWTALPQAEVERRVHTAAQELMRQLVQSHITLRGHAEPLVEVMDADGRHRSHVRRRTQRPLKTVFGEVVVERAAYSSRGLGELHPVDADLNLPEHKYSHEVERRAVLAAAEHSFERAAAQLLQSTASRLAKRPIEEITRRAVCDFEDFYSARTWSASSQACTGPLLVMSFDEKGVVMRRGDLRSETRRIAEGQEKVLYAIRKRNGKDHWKGRKRMAAVGTTYTIEPDMRTAAEIVLGLRRIRDASSRPKRTVRPEMKRLWASLTQTPVEVIDEAFVEARKRDPEQAKEWIVLIDGDSDLERWVKAAAKRHGVRITLGLDIIHALHYLWRAGEDLCRGREDLLEDWVLERLHRILEGDVANVVAGMTRSATLRKLQPGLRAEVDRCARYFSKRTHMMKYDQLLRLGAPIATGVIEGGCRHLINDRLEISGAKWSLDGAEAVMRARAMVISGDFEEYWTFHERQEHSRNHASRYLHDKPPPVALRRGQTPGLKLVRG